MSLTSRNVEQGAAAVYSRPVRWWGLTAWRSRPIGTVAGVAVPLQSPPVSTRRLIILSLLCGVAILVAFVVQLALVVW